jgi:hypothetical protein
MRDRCDRVRLSAASDPSTYAARTRTHAGGPSVRRPAPGVDHGTMRYYHATSAAQAILADGFRDWSGSYGLRDV